MNFFKVKTGPAAVLACAWILMASGCAADAGFSIVSGRSPAAAFIVTPEQAEEISACGVAREMIEDFNADLYECAGCGLPVLEEDGGSLNAIRFMIEARTAGDEDRFGITFPDERTMLITGSTVSLRWALNHVLSEHAGVRYLAMSEHGAHFPRLEDLSAPRVPVQESPSFYLSRQHRFGENYWNRRMNNFFHTVGAGAYRAPCGHYLALRAYPVLRYMSRGEWPDFIFPVVDGERYLPYNDPSRGDRWQDYSSGWQPCFTSEEGVREAVRNLVAYFDANPGIHGTSIGLNDLGLNFCECEGCAPLIGEGRNMTGHRDFSGIYYRWANMVAEGVAEKHPDRFLGTLAYRETLEPPGFRLHDNLVPHIAYDLHSCQDAEVRAGWESLLERWSAKARYLGRWEYGQGARVYNMPRVYFGLQQEMMQADHAAGVRAFYIERGGAIEDGPKKYLYHRLLWDVDLDLDEALGEWYEACVGARAAPYLAEYFRVWEEIWREEAVKTAWFQSSKNSVYLSMGNQSYLYAVRPGDLELLRGLAEKVVELARLNGDERQAGRAEWLMADFRHSEACIYAIGGHIFPPSGTAETAGQAVEYLGFLAEALEYEGMISELHGRRMAVFLNPDFPERVHPYVYMSLAQVAAAASDPAVMEAMESAARDSRLPGEIRSLIDVFIRMERGEPVANLMLDGAFEEGNSDWQDMVWESIRGVDVPVELSQERAYRGENSLKLELGPRLKTIVSAHGRDFPYRRAEPGRYYVSVMVYLDSGHQDVESFVRLRANAFRDGRRGRHFDSAHVNIPPGEWTRISVIAEVREGIDDGINLDQIMFYNYGRGDTAYVDGVVVVPLGI